MFYVCRYLGACVHEGQVHPLMEVCILIHRLHCIYSTSSAVILSTAEFVVAILKGHTTVVRCHGFNIATLSDIVLRTAGNRN